MKFSLFRHLCIISGLSVVATLVHGCATYEEWAVVYTSSLVFTGTLWLGCITIISRIRKWYPGAGNTARRIGAQFVVVTVFALLAAVVLENILTLLRLGHYADETDVLTTIRTCLIMVYSVSAVYEAAYFFSLWRKAEAEASALQEANLTAQLSRLKAELNPHFLFNNFNSLASVIEEDPAKATRMVEALSKYYRYILKAESATLCTLAEEIESLEAYAFLLHIRHEEAFVLKIEVHESCLAYQLPALTLQTLAENATKHNAVTLETPLLLEITCKANGILQVCNNLVRRHGTAPGAGVGLSNLKERCRLLGLGLLSYSLLADTFRVEVPMRLPTEMPDSAPKIHAHTVV